MFFIPELEPVGHVCDDDAGELDGPDEAHPDDAGLADERLAVLAPAVHQVDRRQVLHRQRITYKEQLASHKQGCQMALAKFLDPMCFALQA